jgi:hypothetical protein
VVLALGVVLFIKKKGITLIIPNSAVFLVDLFVFINAMYIAIKTLIDNPQIMSPHPAYYFGMCIAGSDVFVASLQGGIMVVMPLLDHLNSRKKSFR